jgi:copper transport protein
MTVLFRVGMGMALVITLAVSLASPANAHAVLLRTDPSPQTTLPEPPSAISLEFSEPVEVAFGAVRVFDVDGKRVPADSIRLADRDRQVILPVEGLGDGTYTVTWRVASADGHPIFGGFTFYIGAPSTISPVAVEADKEASAPVRWTYGAVRFGWFASLIALVGLVTARRWVWTPAVRATQLDGSPGATVFRDGFRVALRVAWAVLGVTGLLWLVFETKTLSGLSLLSSMKPSVLGEVLRTTFGRWWTAGLVLTALAAVPIAALTRRRGLFGWSPVSWIAVLGILVTGVAFASALTGHARTDPIPALAVPSVAVHLLTVGVWVGGLGALVVLGGRAWRALPSDGRPALLREVVVRFSRLAVVAVIVLVATGVILSLANLGPLSDLWKVAYGRVLLAKIFLLAVALIIASRHLWVVPRRLNAADASGRAATVVAFQRSAGAELGVLVGALALAAALVALVPGRSLAAAGEGAVNQERRVGAHTVQLFIDPSTVGPNQIHATFIDDSGLGASDVTNVAIRVGRTGSVPEPVEMRLISPGHFVGDATLGSAGRYRLSVTVGADPSGPSTTFDFRLSDRGGDGR